LHCFLISHLLQLWPIECFSLMQRTGVLDIFSNISFESRALCSQFYHIRGFEYFLATLTSEHSKSRMLRFRSFCWVAYCFCFYISGIGLCNFCINFLSCSTIAIPFIFIFNFHSVWLMVLRLLHCYYHLPIRNHVLPSSRV